MKTDGGQTTAISALYRVLHGVFQFGAITKRLPVSLCFSSNSGMAPSGTRIRKHNGLNKPHGEKHSSFSICGNLGECVLFPFMCKRC